MIIESLLFAFSHYGCVYYLALSIAGCSLLAIVLAALVQDVVYVSSSVCHISVARLECGHKCVQDCLVYLHASKCVITIGPLRACFRVTNAVKDLLQILALNPVCLGKNIVEFV